MGTPFEKEDIVEGMDGRRERKYITAASAAYLNIAVEPTPTASARASLRLLARLTASVRPPVVRNSLCSA